MFKQITDLAGGEVYLTFSLLMFLVFFIIVGIYLLKMNKKHIENMSSLPFQDNNAQTNEED
ncbi:CcoQ/FixQ family Cbb3-type cytochrome c oxidase assembly chaperone [Pedobacter changchengzhani]|uniref:CcoQ/FixQ family Cbb3-type cytochrome c oxidase assembly chaperone n=1 Tax=Pedobacter changchengzhani TaxID=2529274 RepID=A0A4R5MMW9_9SPHI|nr:CcoQ/FixQ family Cbb3-type cytochrome c oxidase assembly chaperone [Pedobacter changchengzhani]TDG36635.1 CcoQ/FixQ family Cbb3-type cytochrome c oxidase assembly chaperone [Pedobacter changchengzhani]